MAADEDAPQRLLQPIAKKEELKKNKKQEQELGIFYDDEYDYMQHLKSRDEFFDSEFDLEEVDKIIIEKPDAAQATNVTKLNLPKEVFASEEQEEIGLLNKAAPHHGPRIDWDPDIVETLDDEFKHEVVYTLKDEDMSDDDDNDLDMLLAEAREEGESNGYSGDESGDEYTDYDSDEARDDVPSLDGGFSNFSDEETKSKFTSYSMSSSVIRRNEGLTRLDDQFEKFFCDQYDDEEVGDLGMDDILGYQREDGIVMKQNLQRYEKDQAENRQTYDEDIRRKTILTEQDQTTDTRVESLEIVEEEEEDRLDCESILTTYSTLYNHPKLIKEPSIKVKPHLKILKFLLVTAFHFKLLETSQCSEDSCSCRF